MIPAQLLAIIGVIAVGIWSLKKLRDNFSQRLFFTIGMWLFIVQGLSASYGLIVDFNLLPVWAIISRVASLLFNFLIAFFFGFMRKNTPEVSGETTLSPEEISKFLDDEAE